MFLRYYDFYYRPAIIYKIDINTTARTLTLLKNNNFFKVYPISIGKPSTPTPKGTFKIINKAINPGGPFGARWLGLNKSGYGIHGTNNPASIGKAVSNGCIRTFNENIIEISSLIPIGTPVSIN